MSSWRTDPPKDIVGELYDEDGEEQPMSDDGDDNEDETEDPQPSSLFGPSSLWGVMTSVKVERESSLSPNNKRQKISSDLQPSSSSIVIKTNDANCTPINKDDMNTDLPDMFLISDQHALYESDKDASDNNVGTAVRGRKRERVRGRPRGRPRGVSGLARSDREDLQPRAPVIHPIEEIWVTDDDVPIELKEMAMDVVTNRQIRQQEMRDRAARNERDRECEGNDRVSEDDDKSFQDANGGMGNQLIEGMISHFEWFPMNTFRGEEEPFEPKRTGSVESYSTAYDAFRSYWDDSVIQHVVDETNWYATQISSAAFQSDWYPTNSHEVLCLFAFWIMLGIIRMPSIKSCFSTDPLLKTEIFRRIFTLRRYSTLSRALQFVDADPAIVAANPSNSGPAGSSDRLQFMTPIITHLNTKFQANYVPSKDINIDVQNLALSKGRLDIRQSIRTQNAKAGVKSFELCESATGYLWSFTVYKGKQSSLDEQHDPFAVKSTAIVQKLIGPLLNKGYRLFVDNWYNPIRLGRFLKRFGTDCVGTLPPSYQDVPPLVIHAPLKQGQLIARHSGDVCVLSWQDRSRFNMMSTCHGTAAALSSVPTKPVALRFKPQVVLDYNKSRGGVELKDSMLEPYLIERSRCSYMQLFKRLLNCSILNARILLQSSIQCPQDDLTFRLRLVDAILNNHLSLCTPNRRHFIRSLDPNPWRTVPEIHWPVLLEESASYKAQNRKTRAKCSVCLREGRKTQKTTYKCEACNVPLCAVGCFKKYHTT